MIHREPLNTVLRQQVKLLKTQVHLQEGELGAIPKKDLLRMLDEMEVETSYGKLCIGIGFVQGVLASQGILSIDQWRSMILDTDIFTDESEEKARVLGKVSDAVANFMHYDREDDEDLNISALNEAIDLGYVTLEEIGEEFMFQLCNLREE